MTASSPTSPGGEQTALLKRYYFKKGDSNATSY